MHHFALRNICNMFITEGCVLLRRCCATGYSDPDVSSEPPLANNNAVHHPTPHHCSLTDQLPQPITVTLFLYRPSYRPQWPLRLRHYVRSKRRNMATQWCSVICQESSAISLRKPQNSEVPPSPTEPRTRQTIPYQRLANWFDISTVSFHFCTPPLPRKNYTQLVYPSQHNTTMPPRCKSTRYCSLASANKQVNTSHAWKATKWDLQIDIGSCRTEKQRNAARPAQHANQIPRTCINLGEQNPT